jgi:hypothetical protein
MLPMEIDIDDLLRQPTDNSYEINNNEQSSILSDFNLSKSREDEEEEDDKIRSMKHASGCEHTDRKHYAKGLCKHCYYTKERDEMLLPDKCKHQDKMHYSKGLCKTCYIREYQRKRRAKLAK